MSVAVKRLGGSGTYRVLTAARRELSNTILARNRWSGRSVEVKSRLFRRCRRLRTTTTADTVTPRVFHRRRRAERSATVVFAELYRRRSRRPVPNRFCIHHCRFRLRSYEQTGDSDHGSRWRVTTIGGAINCAGTYLYRTVKYNNVTER